MNKRKKLKFILEFMKPFKWSFINLFICVITTSIIAMSYPYIFSLLIDQVFAKKSLDFFIVIVISYAIIFLGEQLLHFVLNAVWSYLITRFVYDIRRRIIKKFMHAKADRLLKLETGEAMTNINQDANEFMNFIHWNVFYLTANTVKLLSALVFISLLNLKIAGIVAILVPISYFINQRINRLVYEKVFIYREVYGRLSSWLIEMISGIREIKLFGQNRRMSRDYIGKSVELTRAKIEQNKVEFVSERFNVFLVLAVQLIIFTISSFLVANDSFTVGGFVATMMYFTIISMMFRNLAQANVRLQKNFVSINRVFAFLEQEEEQNIGAKLQPNTSEITFQNVSFAYENKPVFDQLSLQIKQGEHVAIVGKSGAGKSSLIQLLQRFYETDNGSIQIGGIPISQFSLKELRTIVGVVQQKTVFFDGTIRDNVTLWDRKISDEEIWNACKKANVAKEVMQLPEQLNTHLDTNAISLSGGQLQRLSIARVLLRKPQILVFDEATSALDGIAEKELLEVMRSLKTTSTIITITHNLSTIIEADRIVVIDEGRVVDSGQISELLERCPVFINLFAEQRRWHEVNELVT